jgi:hypothetical protein
MRAPSRKVSVEMPRDAERSDGALLAAVVAGDGAAFATFYRRHLPAVVGFLLRETGDRGGARPAPAAQPGVRVVLTAAPGAAPRAIERSAQILRERLHAVIPRANVSTASGRIVVSAAHAPARARGQIIALAAPGGLAFYDWEAGALAPNGKPVASQLPSPDPSVLDISQGNGSSAPGELGSGCVPLQQALAMANRLGAGSARRTEYIGKLKLRVPIGYTLLQAAGPGLGQPSDGYFVVRERRAISNGAIVNPQASRDRTMGTPLVEFGFTPSGQRAFQALTAGIARRGTLVSGVGDTLNQHFAVALDNQLLTVPFIDFKQYPDGINGDHGADIAGSFSTQSAKDLAILLRYGPLPVILTATG